MPQDYKELITAYGPGQFCGFITLYQPHAPSEWADLTGPVPTRLRGQIEEVRQAARHPLQLPHSPEDLFAMGVTGNGDYLFWVTQPADTPDEWTVAVNDGPARALVHLQRHLDLDHGAAFTESSPPAAAARTSVSTRTIRDWANANGYDLPERGRVPIEVIEAWKQEHPS
ncbi:Lsr2 family DNA-binding protein [Streptomyces sp. NBC_00525]|uniref:Lsr2 family DNA-binding protein n=1 Tax=Streptomyces sp. NBC_00525 TaxID=2903660 RepID=UPI002E80075B|nr:histone-like nucleoid-structuring protein Lsr2 [Streptomyces sp. NBC_00525]WUC92101.1 Lsr2 family protein [Streptomyces sp. NBC_00525]WUC97544.1 Lsr2 family protein [Streptomyces sp. NBC_00525]